MLIEIKDKQGEAIELKAITLLAAHGITAVPAYAYKCAVREYVEDYMNNIESKLIYMMSDEEFEKSVDNITENIVNASEDVFDESFVHFMITNGLTELSSKDQKQE